MDWACCAFAAECGSDADVNVKGAESRDLCYRSSQMWLAMVALFEEAVHSSEADGAKGCDIRLLFLLTGLLFQDPFT